MSSQLAASRSQLDSIATEQAEVASLRASLQREQETHERAQKALERWVRRYALLSAREKRADALRDDQRVGSVVLQPMGHRVVETWREGSVGFSAATHPEVPRAASPPRRDWRGARARGGGATHAATRSRVGADAWEGDAASRRRD